MTRSMLSLSGSLFPVAVLCLIAALPSPARAALGDVVDLNKQYVVKTPETAEDFVVADLNGDKKDDLLVRCSDGSTVAMISGGDGIFRQGSILRIPTPGIAGPPVVADFDGDGKVDVIFAVRAEQSDASDSRGGSIYFFAGRGDGTLSTVATACNLDYCPPGPYNTLGQDVGRGSYGGVLETRHVHPSGNALFAADFNGDGKMDLLVIERDLSYAVRDSTRFFILPGMGNGTFGPPLPVPPEQEDIPGMACAVVADLNGDGHPDIVFGEDMAQPVRVFLNKGDATFRIVSSSDSPLPPPPPVSATPPARKPGALPAGTRTPILRTESAGWDVAPVYTIATADMNGDHIPDLILGSEREAVIITGKGDGTFTRSDTAQCGCANLLVTGDFNGDGKQDLVTFPVPPNNSTVLYTIQYLSGSGKGNVAPPWMFPLQVGPSNYAYRYGTPRYRITSARYPTYGSNDSSKGPYYLSNPIATFCSTGDFNGDGLPDLVLINGEPGTSRVAVQIYTNMTGVPIYSRFSAGVYLLGGGIFIVMSSIIGVCLWYFRPGPTRVRDYAATRNSFPPPVKAPPERFI